MGFTRPLKPRRARRWVAVVMPPARPDATRWALQFENGEIRQGSKHWVMATWRERRAEGRPVDVVFRTKMIEEWRDYDMSHVHFLDPKPGA